MAAATDWKRLSAALGCSARHTLLHDFLISLCYCFIFTRNNHCIYSSNITVAAFYDHSSPQAELVQTESRVWTPDGTKSIIHFPFKCVLFSADPSRGNICLKAAGWSWPGSAQKAFRAFFTERKLPAADTKETDQRGERELI